MKKILTLLLIFPFLISNAQETKNYSIDNFDEINISGPFKVILNQSNSPTLTITSYDYSLDEVEVRNRGGELTIKLDSRMFSDLKKSDKELIKVEIAYESLRAIEANMGTRLYFEETLKSENLDVSLNMGGKIEVDLNCAFLSAKVNMGGNIKATGKADEADITINMGGEFKGRELEIKDVFANVTMGGTMVVNCTEKIDASVNMGGDITYYGDPAKSHTETSLGGSISRKPYN